MKPLLTTLLLYMTFTLTVFSQSFKQVKIGNQVWMAENLNVDTFRNGDPIPQAKTAEEWKQAGENKRPAWCYYDNDVANGMKYGKLYNGYAVKDSRGLAPEGWYVPTDKEWTTLETFLRGESAAVRKIKSTSGWGNNLNGTNTSGFSGLPGGYRAFDGIFDHIGVYGWWWSTIDFEPGNTRWQILYKKFATQLGDPQGGVSVRCLKE